MEQVQRSQLDMTKQPLNHPSGYLVVCIWCSHAEHAMFWCWPVFVCWSCSAICCRVAWGWTLWTLDRHRIQQLAAAALTMAPLHRKSESACFNISENLKKFKWEYKHIVMKNLSKHLNQCSTTENKRSYCCRVEYVLKAHFLTTPYCVDLWLVL